ncbi:MAG: hypothetical protein ACK5L3_05510 [Oscillospiraceae bacterium]
MKRFKTALSLVLCALLLLPILAACSGDGLSNAVYGRYVEEDISPEGLKGYPQNFVSFGGGVLDLISLDWGTGNNSTTTYMRWRSTDDGKSWQQQDMSWTKEYVNDYSSYYQNGQTPPEEVYMNDLLPLSNGDALVRIDTTVYDQSQEADGKGAMGTQTSQLLRVGPDGTKTPFSVPDYDALVAEGTAAYFNTLQTLPGDRVYISFSVNPTEEQMNDPNFDWNSTERKAVYDAKTGQKLYDLDFSGWQMYYNSSILFVTTADGGVNAVNLADGTPVQNANLPSDEIMQQVLQGNYMSSALVDDDNNFYSVTARGMDKYAPGATEAEPVMDGINYTYGSPLYGISSVIYNAEDKAFLMAVSESGSNITTGKLLRYTWSDEALASSDNKIKIYSLYDNYSVRLALSEFKRQNPEVTLEYETAFAADTSGMLYSGRMGGASTSESGDTAKTEEDALRALNTELLNGTGPDVLILDGLPVESFIEKGVLEDLTSLVKDNADLYQQLFAPMQTDGKLNAVPTNFTVPTMFGEKGYVENFTSLDSLVSAIQNGADLPAYQEWNPEWTEEEQNAYYAEMDRPKADEEQPTLYFDSLDDMFNTFYTSSAPAIFGEKKGIDQQQLSAFLTALKQVSDKYQLASPDNASMGGSYGYSTMGYASYEYSQTLNRYTQRQSRLGYSNLTSLNILTNIPLSIYYSAMPSYGYTGGSESGQQEQAEATLPPMNPSYASAPGLAQGVYVPKNIAGVTTTSKQADLARSFVQVMLGEEVQKHDMGNGFPVSKAAFKTQYENYMATEMYITSSEKISMLPYDYEGVINSLQTPFYANDYLRSVIYKPVQSYCAGTIGLEEAVSQIVKETELYFAERQ